MTYDLCAEVIDTSILVSEDEIRSATRHLIETHHMLVEGAAGVALAGLLKLREQFRAKRVAVVICGANIGIDKLRQCSPRARQRRSRLTKITQVINAQIKPIAPIIPRQ